MHIDEFPADIPLTPQAHGPAPDARPRESGPAMIRALKWIYGFIFAEFRLEGAVPGHRRGHLGDGGERAGDGNSLQAPLGYKNLPDDLEISYEPVTRSYWNCAARPYSFRRNAPRRNSRYVGRAAGNTHLPDRQRYVNLPRGVTCCAPFRRRRASISSRARSGSAGGGALLGRGRQWLRGGEL